MNNDQRRMIYEQANGCCEYCKTCEVNTGQTMQIDHIDPEGGDSLQNLALACWNCNNHKRRATHAADPETAEIVRLFHPRQDNWQTHFVWIDDGIQLLGRTAIGRATIARLKMNRPSILVARRRWIDAGYHPPDVDG
jgi:hypothetical protein